MTENPTFIALYVLPKVCMLCVFNCLIIKAQLIREQQRLREQEEERLRKEEEERIRKEEEAERQREEKVNNT